MQFTDFHLAAPVIDGHAEMADLLARISEFPERIAAATARRDEALRAFAAAVPAFKKVNDEAMQREAARTAHFQDADRRRKAERAYNEWLDATRIYRDCPEENFHLKRIVDAGPAADPKKIEVRPDPGPMPVEEETAYVVKFRALLACAKAVDDASLAVGKLLVEKADLEQKLMMAEGEAARATKMGLDSVTAYEHDAALERARGEEQLRELEQQNAENSKRRDELQSKLGIVERIANALKG